MQQLTGKIVSVQPTAEGGYQSRQGWINTFTMTIQGPNAQATGEIGSKVTPYPAAAGQEITVTAEQTGYGLKFKKVNPQYSGGSGGGGSPEKEERIIRGNALNAIMSATDITPLEIENYLMAGVNFIKSGVWGLSQQEVQPNPEYSDNPEPIDDTDEIPF